MRYTMRLKGSLLKMNNEATKQIGVVHSIGQEGAKKLLGMLGFAARARKLVCGTDLCRDEIRRGKLQLVLVASDASQNTKKRIIASKK